MFGVTEAVLNYSSLIYAFGRESARAVASMVGYERDPIRNVRLRDCVFSGVQQDSEIEYVEGACPFATSWSTASR